MSCIVTKLNKINTELYSEVDAGNYQKCIELLQEREELLAKLQPHFSSENSNSIDDLLVNEIQRMKEKDPILISALKKNMDIIGEKIAKHKVSKNSYAPQGKCLNKTC